MDSSFVASRLISGVILWLWLALGGVSSAQGEMSWDFRPLAPEARKAILCEGLVFDMLGNPAVGSMVVSSLGGKALTDAAGSYRLALEVPIAATTVQITAVGSVGGNLLASESVALLGTSTTLRGGTARAGRSSSPSATISSP